MYFRKNINMRVDIDVVLDMISENRKKAIDEYGKFMDIECKEDVYEKTEPIGEMVYKENTKEQMKKSCRKNLDDLLKDTGIDEQTFKLIKSGSRKRNLTQYKLQYILEAMKLQYTMEQIGLNIGMKKAGIYDLKERYEADN